MKKSTSSLLVLAAAALFTSFQSYAQFQYSDGYDSYDPSQSYGQYGMNEVVSRQVLQPLMPFQRLQLSQLLQISQPRQKQISSLTIQAQSPRNTEIQVLSRGRLISTIQVRRNSPSGQIQLPAGLLLQQIELAATEEELFIQHISAEIQSGNSGGYQDNYGQYPGQMGIEPNSLVTIQLNRQVQGHAVIDLERVVAQQYGISLEGVEIQRVVVEGEQLRYGHTASLQVELNNRIVGPVKYISSAREQTPFPINSLEDVRSLRLIVQGHALIENVKIRVGRVNQRQHHSQRIQVPISQEIMAGQQLSLAQYLPYENRLVRAITLHANPRRASQSQVKILGFLQILGEVTVTQAGMAPTLRLYQPIPLRELKLQSQSPVQISSIDLEF